MVGLTTLEPVTAVAMTVTARLQQGIVLDTLFGTALDGLLTSVIRDRHKAERSTATGTTVTGSLLDGGLHPDNPATIELPLARCTADPDQWHWMCTTAFPTDFNGHPVTGDSDVHHHHSRVRERLVDHTVTRIPASIPPGSGRYRMRRLPIVTTPAAGVSWQAVGDPDTITDLLTDLPAIGKRRGTGEGTVLSWEVTIDDDADTNRHGHCHPNNTLGRPVPTVCATNLNLPTDRTATAGIRPPYWHPFTQHTVVIPEPLNSPGGP